MRYLLGRILGNIENGEIINLLDKVILVDKIGHSSIYFIDILFSEKERSEKIVSLFIYCNIFIVFDGNV